jgi:two-component system chemotaxis response regulator CheB
MNIVVIGISTGGPRALRELFCELPVLNACILLVQHMPRFINHSVCKTVQEGTRMRVSLAEEGRAMQAGEVLLAPSEVHMPVENNRRVRLLNTRKVNYVCPAVDVTMKTLKKNVSDRYVGVVMTGLGRDGADGICHIKQLGGLTLVQNEVTSTIFGMPKAAIATGCVDYEGCPTAIRQKLIDTVGLLKTDPAFTAAGVS